MVIFLFLRNLSATLIPSLALPLSVVGTFAVMKPLGFSLDNLSLMALTLAVGFVVDDAIVMLENIVRHMEMGKRAAAGRARRLARDRLHHPLDDAVAGRRVHPGAVHGRPARPAVPRVRGHDQRRDPGLGLRLADADADDVQPLPAAPSATSSTAASTRRSSACSSARSRFYERTLAWVMDHRRVALVFSARDPGRHRRAVPARAQGLHPQRGHRPDHRHHRDRRGHLVRGDGAPPAARSRRSSQKDPNVAGFMSSVGGGGGGGSRNQGRLVHPAQAARTSGS